MRGEWGEGGGGLGLVEIWGQPTKLSNDLRVERGATAGAKRQQKQPTAYSHN